MSTNNDNVLASEHKYNRALPQFVRKDIDQEAQEWKQQFLDGFKNAWINEEHVDWGLAMSSCRIFRRYVSSLTYPLTDGDREQLCKLLIPLITHKECTSDCQTRIASVLNRVIQ
jgi:hypothetical protein